MQTNDLFNFGLTLIFLTGLILSGHSCNEEDDHHMDGQPDYHIHILSPDPTSYLAGETLNVKLMFEDHNGGVVHHINVRIYNVSTMEEIYYAPLEAHVHAAEEYLFEDQLVLDVDPASDWILEAKVWGHEDGLAEVSETVQFHVHP